MHGDLVMKCAASYNVQGKETTSAHIITNDTNFMFQQQLANIHILRTVRDDLITPLLRGQFLKLLLI